MKRARRQTGRGAFLALSWLYACAPDVHFVPWPELATDTVAVASAVECDGILGVSLSPRSNATLSALRLEACDDAIVSVLEYGEPPDTFDLEYGTLEPELSTECGVLPLPPASRTHVARFEVSEGEGFEHLPSEEARPGALGRFRTQQYCPCRPLRLARTLEIAEARRVFVEPEGELTALVFASNVDRISIYRSDLESIELVHSSTITAAPPSEALGSDRGVNDVTAGPPGVYYLAGDLGEVHVFEPGVGLRLFATLPNGEEIRRLAASPNPEAPEIYVLTHSETLLRFANQTWFEFDAALPPGPGSSQRPGLVWLGPGRVVVVPNNGGDVAFSDGDHLRSHAWSEAGSIHAVGLVPSIGLIAGTRRTKVFRLDDTEPSTWQEVVGPNHEPMVPTGSWFQQIRPTPTGFASALDGPHSLILFEERWGYCGQQVFERFHVNMGRFAPVGSRILAGGAPSDFAPASGPIQLPVLEPE